MKRKKLISAVTALSMVMLLMACANTTAGNVRTNSNCVEGCGCTDCICCEDSDNRTAIDIDTDEQTYIPESSEEQIQEQTDSETEIGESTQAEPETGSELQTEAVNDVQSLTEGEKEARRELQSNLVEAREALYMLENSKEKTTRINEIDKQILANNSYDFSNKNIVFIGDSITEGITAAIDQNGNYLSYVTYANSYLHCQSVLNHGKGGRMFSNYGGEELSLALNFDNVTNVESDIIVVFAGVNDYLSELPNKRFGNVYDAMSTAGYCGSLRYFMKQLKEYYSDRDIFFVTMYDVSRESNCTYSDFDGQPDLSDFMDVERKLAKEYGFNIIELYDTGFMDCSGNESSDYYLRDGLHPKDTGNIVLGEHIAAELSLYFSQKTE